MTHVCSAGYVEYGTCTDCLGRIWDGRASIIHVFGETLHVVVPPCVHSHSSALHTGVCVPSQVRRWLVPPQLLPQQQQPLLQRLLPPPILHGDNRSKNSESSHSYLHTVGQGTYTTTTTTTSPLLQLLPPPILHGDSS